MQLLFKNHVIIANKWLVLLSGLKKDAVNINGKKVYEKHYFHLPDEWTNVNWTITKIKQILAYAGICDSHGDLGVVDLDELAELLHCSVRSLQNNNRFFQKIGLIRLEELYGNLVAIQLVNYNQNFRDLYKKTSSSNLSNDEEKEYISRTGYTTIKREALFDLFALKKVNVLRIACRFFYLHEIEVNLGGNKTVLMESHTLKGFLPAYFSYKPVIERAIVPLRRLLEMEFLDVKVDKQTLLKEWKVTPNFIEKLKAPYLLSMKLHPTKDSRFVRQVEEDINYIDYFTLNQLYSVTKMKEVSFRSIQDLIFEYGGSVVRKAFDDIISCYQEGCEGISEAAISAFQEIKNLQFNSEPVGTLRKILKKFAIQQQEGYLFQF